MNIHGKRRAIAGLVLAGGLAGAAVVTTATGAHAEQGATTITQQVYIWKDRLNPALEACLREFGRPVPPATMTACVRDLAAPDPTSALQLDAFRFFTNCLSIAYYQSLDDMYPSVEAYEDHVNECLGL